MGRQNKEQVKQTYRLTLTNVQESKDIRSMTHSKAGFTVILTTAVVFTVLFIYCLIAFTPIKTTIPGYPDAVSRRNAITNAIRIDSLENAITRWKIYADNISRTVAGEQTLVLDSLMRPGANEYLKNKSAERMAKQDSLLKAKVKEEEQFEVSRKRERILPIEGRHFFTPINGVVSAPFNRVLHPALDITAPVNSVVKAALDGTVIYDGWSAEQGYTIAIQHSGETITIYSGNQKLLKKAGDKVVAGSPIALVGSNSSLTKGDHLHFELWYEGEPLDPAQFISF